MLSLCSLDFTASEEKLLISDEEPIKLGIPRSKCRIFTSSVGSFSQEDLEPKTSESSDRDPSIGTADVSMILSREPSVYQLEQPSPEIRPCSPCVKKPKSRGFRLAKIMRRFFRRSKVKNSQYA